MLVGTGLRPAPTPSTNPALVGATQRVVRGAYEPHGSLHRPYGTQSSSHNLSQHFVLGYSKSSLRDSAQCVDEHALFSAIVLDAVPLVVGAGLVLLYKLNAILPWDRVRREARLPGSCTPGRSRTKIFRASTTM
jgi:hypothetical protein